MVTSDHLILQPCLCFSLQKWACYSLKHLTTKMTRQKLISENFLARGKLSFCNMCLSLRYSVLGNKFVCVASIDRSFEHQFVWLITCPLQCVITLSHSLTCVNAMANISERLATTKTCCIWFNFFVTSIAGS